MYAVLVKYFTSFLLYAYMCVVLTQAKFSQSPCIQQTLSRLLQLGSDSINQSSVYSSSGLSDYNGIKSSEHSAYADNVVIISQTRTPLKYVVEKKWTCNRELGVQLNTCKLQPRLLK